MKYVFYSLILINVVFFLWESNILGRGGKDITSHQELRLPHTVEQIILLSERSASAEKGSDTQIADIGTAETNRESVKGGTLAVESELAQKAQVATDPIPGPAKATESSCFQWGPITEELRARKVLDRVRARSDQAALAKKPSDLIDGWWVLFPKAHDMETAKSNRTMLLEKGVSDLWLFDKGVLQGAISLGLFKTRSRAEQAQEKFIEQGIITEVVPRRVRGEAYWVRIPWTRPAVELEDIVKSLDPKGATGSSTSLIPCN